MTIQIDCTCIRKNARLAALFILPMTALTASAQTAPSADLAIFNTVANPNSGRYEFIITVVNNGPSAAEQVVVSDALPPGVTFEKVVFNSKKVSSCNFPPVGQTGLVSCTTGTASLEPGAGFSVSIVVNVTGLSRTEITDTATVTSPTPDPNYVNNSASDTITVR